MIRNSGSSAVDVESSGIGIMLLGLSSKSLFDPSDGRSTAVITQADTILRCSEQRIGRKNFSADYTIHIESCSPQSLILGPGQSMKIRTTFALPPGQYQFQFGCGGGVHEEKSLASNAIPFDIGKDRIAVLVKQNSNENH